ncbi:dethiobiotin synthetase [Prosthecobacter debontii]|uniref:ATP-dependent dethiobiotin synthetase BioD n=1 Tax=Prosthecobacter debontii TaxID=48467 RepID=A0A1T4Y5H0_9BACT|nr:dethiobiotin synthase [Prosthecobacter debontii]SKA96561.1 dethiobiotin synthetase [Prosthecobacter debontii]
MHYFITGTDTDAGKTYVTCLLVEALRRAGHAAVGYKPFACGDRIDAHALRQASEDALTLEEINPVYLKVPASPYAAALLENKTVDVETARQGFYSLAARFSHVLVEGAGGWEVPLEGKRTMADFAADLGLPVILVVNNRLGCLNHTLLTVKNIQARGLTCAGIILNHAQDERDLASISNRMILDNFLNIPVLSEVMHAESQMDWPADLPL